MKFIPAPLTTALRPWIEAANRRVFAALSPLAPLSLPARPRVSFCTTCMGRLHHVRETLPANLRDNEDYPDVEFVLLDYNSGDGLGEWVRRELSTQIREGRVVYARTDEPRYFRNSHAKNVAHRLATGDILCNVDADNFTGPSFARFLVDQLSPNPRRVLCGHYSLARGTTGRIALHREAFFHAGGYAEDFKGWGLEDLDLVRRLERIGLETALIREPLYLRTIEHDPLESVVHMAPGLRDIHRSTPANRALFLRGGWCWRFRANLARPWGRAVLKKNFSDDPVYL